MAPRSKRSAIASAGGAERGPGDGEVLEHGEVVEQLGGLERAAKAGLRPAVRSQAVHRPAGKGDGAGVGTHVAGDGVEQRRLAGAVRPDEPR